MTEDEFRLGVRDYVRDEDYPSSIGNRPVYFLLPRGLADSELGEKAEILEVPLEIESQYELHRLL